MSTNGFHKRHEDTTEMTTVVQFLDIKEFIAISLTSISTTNFSRNYDLAIVAPDHSSVC
jgi:hypothetical protein